MWLSFNVSDIFFEDCLTQGGDFEEWTKAIILWTGWKSADNGMC